MAARDVRRRARRSRTPSIRWSSSAAPTSNLVGDLTVAQPLQNETDAVNYVARLALVGTPDERGDRRSEAHCGAAVSFRRASFFARRIAQMQQFISRRRRRRTRSSRHSRRGSRVMPELSEARGARTCSPRRSGSSPPASTPPGSRRSRLLEEQLPVLDRRRRLEPVEERRRSCTPYQLRRFTTTSSQRRPRFTRSACARSPASSGEMDVILRKLGRTEGSIKDRIERLRRGSRAIRRPTEGRARRSWPTSTQIIRGRGAALGDARSTSGPARRSSPSRTRRSARPTPPPATAPPPLDASRPGDLPDAAAAGSDDEVRPALASSTTRPCPAITSISRSASRTRALPRFQTHPRLRHASRPSSKDGRSTPNGSPPRRAGTTTIPKGCSGSSSAELFRARRLVVDTGLHAKGWTRQQAIDYGIEASEVERYVVLPGQACSYMIGQLRIIELRGPGQGGAGRPFLDEGVPQRRPQRRRRAAGDSRIRSRRLHQLDHRKEGVIT